MERVLSGGNFRDSYKDVGLNLDKVQGEDPVASLKKRTSTGTAGNLRIDVDRKWLDDISSAIESRSSILRNAYSGLIPGLTEVVL